MKSATGYFSLNSFCLIKLDCLELTHCQPCHSWWQPFSDHKKCRAELPNIFSYLENVISGQRLRCVPTESYKGSRHRHRKQYYIQHLQASNFFSQLFLEIVCLTYFDLQLDRSGEVSHRVGGMASVLSPLLRVDIGQWEDTGGVNTGPPVLTMATGPRGHHHMGAEPGPRKLPTDCGLIIAM